MGDTYAPSTIGVINIANVEYEQKTKTWLKQKPQSNKYLDKFFLECMFIVCTWHLHAKLLITHIFMFMHS